MPYLATITHLIASATFLEDHISIKYKCFFFFYLALFFNILIIKENPDA